jgi:hypothetical protein
MPRARVYFYLTPLGECAAAPEPGLMASAVPKTPCTGIDESESRFLAFVHDPTGRCEVIRVPEQTNECVCRVLKARHPYKSVELRSVQWLT